MYTVLTFFFFSLFPKCLICGVLSVGERGLGAGEDIYVLCCWYVWRVWRGKGKGGVDIR